MAAHGKKFIRVRLHFDYPPPAVVDCRMCWLLVDMNTCRVVADVESLIREKFEFSRRSILSLFIEDCYLPHNESVHVVRDNDSVRVKVDVLAQVNGHSSAPDAASRSCRKRQRPTEEDGLGQNGVSVEWKKKKRKKRSEESQEREAKQASADESKEKSQVKKKKKKKKKKKVEDNSPSLTPKPAASTKKSTASVDQPVKNTKKPPVAPKTHTVSSSDSSSSSEEDEAPIKPAAPKPAAKAPPTTPAAPPATKPTQKKPHPPSSSSSDSVSSSSDEDTTRKTLPKDKTPPKGTTNANSKPQQAPPKPAGSSAAPPRDETVAPCNSDSEDEIKLVIRRPMQQSGHNVGSPSSWRGRGRGQPRCGGPGGRGRGGGRGANRGHSSSSEFSCSGAKEPSCHTDSLTNVSVVLQNTECSIAPRQDYSSLPLLAAPPQVGQKIAFKLLELTENYTPEVSEYKEGKIVSFDITTKLIELELLNTCQAPVEPGKFDLVYQNPDGSESVEYAVSRSSRVTERWDSLLEPRLII